MPLPITSTALLIIDMQVGLVDEPLHEKARTLANIQSMLNAARTANVPLIYMQDKDVGGVGTPDWAIHPAVAPQPGERVIPKPEADSFYETGLGAVLTDLSITHLLVVGLKTEACVDQTVRRAHELGYYVTLVADGHSSSGRAYMSGEQIVTHHNWLLACVGTEAHYIDVQPAAAIAFA